MEGSRVEKSVPRVPFFRLFSFADSVDYGLMALGSLGACVHGASVPVWFIFFGKLINSLGLAFLDPSAAAEKVARYSLLFVYLSIVVLFSSWAEVACWMYSGERQTTRIRLAYLKAILNHDVSFFDTDATSGEVISAITEDVIVIQDAISEKVGNFLHYISRFVAGFAVGFATVWQLSLVTLSIVPVIALAGGIHAFVVIVLSKRIRMSYVKAGGLAEEVVANLRTVYAFVGEEKSVASYRAALKETYKLGIKGGIAKGLGLGILYFVLYLCWSLLLWYTSHLVHKGIVNGGEAFTTMLNVVISGMALGQAAPDLAAFAKARTAAYTVFKIIQETKVSKKEKHAKKGLELKSVLGNLEFKNVSFRYPSRPDVSIFENINFKIPAGKVVAFVGGSGSGKSTVVSLIERFYEPSSGQVLLDEHDASTLDLKWYRRQIGLVNQEPALFATSIKENILYGKEDATMEDIIQAAKLSDAHPFINNLPERYETQVGERGVQLSGGQKQRIAIARAMVKNPAILLLDEATSALDAETEKSVHDAIDRVLTGRTTVIVAHRLSTIRNADTIAVLQNGKIVESGDHESLISRNGSYAALVKLQESRSSSIPLESSSINQSGHSKHQNLSGSMSLRTFSFGASVASEKGSSKRFGSEIDPRDEYIESPKKKVSFGRLVKMVAPDWLYGIFGALGCIAAGAMTPLFALGMTTGMVSLYSIDYGHTKREIRKICLLFVGASITSFCAHMTAHFSFGTMGERLAFRVREMMFSAVLRNEVAWFDDDSHSSGAISARIGTDAVLVRSLVVDRIAILIQNLSIIVISFIIAFLEQWRLTLVLLATFPLLVIAQMSERFFMQGYGGNLSEAYLKANMLASESVSNIRTVAAFSAEDKVVAMFSRELRIPGKQAFRRGQIAGIFYGGAQFTMFSSYGLALWYASTLIKHGEAGFASVMKTFMVLIVSALIVAETLATCPDMVKGADAAASTFDIIDRESEIPPEDPAGEEVEHVDGVIELKHVYFNYPSRPDVMIFEDFNLKVRAGRSVALVGTSGSGKSSIIALILRFYEPTAGKVMVDGKDIKKLKLRSLRRHIGLVQQEPALFSTTIYDNILYGKENASEAEVVEAAKLANAHGFINSLPDGYKTEVGERGIQLSGGQKQRVAIARAVLKNPAILLLDEATSALDAESERVVQEALNRLMKNRTTVLIAHRLSTIRNADVICVLQGGKIVEQGNHLDLISRDGSAYTKLITLQQQSSSVL